MTEKTDKGGCLYCPECGHKLRDLKTQSGEFEPAQQVCNFCVADLLDEVLADCHQKIIDSN